MFQRILTIFQEEEKKGGKKGRLLGVITLSDVLRYLIGEANIGNNTDHPRPVPTPTTEDDRSPQPETIAEGS